MAKRGTAILYTKEIIKLYQEGWSSTKIAEKIGISSTSVKNILNKNNIEMRSNSQAKRKYDLDETYFDNIDDQNKAYILGILYADGCNHTPRHLIKLTLKDDDWEILEDIRQVMGLEREIKFATMEHSGWRGIQHVASLLIQNEHMSNRLVELGCVKNKSLILEFPDWIPDNLMPHFLRGYFDGDGYIQDPEKRSNCTMITITSSKIFADALCVYLKDKLNIESHVRTMKNPKTGSLYITKTSEVKKFADYIYADAHLYLKRKHLKYLKKFYPERLEENANNN